MSASQVSAIDSSIISEEIREEVDMTQSMRKEIPDEAATLSSKPAMVSSIFMESKAASGLKKDKSQGRAMN